MNITLPNNLYISEITLFDQSKSVAPFDKAPDGDNERTQDDVVEPHERVVHVAVKALGQKFTLEGEDKSLLQLTYPLSKGRGVRGDGENESFSFISTDIQIREWLNTLEKAEVITSEEKETLKNALSAHTQNVPPPADSHADRTRSVPAFSLHR